MKKLLLPLVILLLAGNAQAACCKVCTSKSKACGNSCISKSFNCSKPKGCACNQGSSGGGGGGKSGGNKNSNNSSNNSSGNNSNNSGNSKKPKKQKVKCPPIIADLTTGTYQTKANYQCFRNKKAAEKKGFLPTS